MIPSLRKKLFTASLALPFILVVVFLVRNHKDSVMPVQAPSEKVEDKPLAHIVEIVKDIVVPEKKPELFEYVQVVDGCGIHFQGACVNVRTAPKSTATVAFKLRNGIVLRVSEKITADGRDWYKVDFNEWLRYPKRVAPELYVAAEFVKPFLDEGNKDTITDASSTKRIIVDRSEQTLYAYEGDDLFMKIKISTGLNVTPTPRGNFTVYRKTPSRYMQGPISGISTHYYDLPGVPWNLYFSNEGAVIHGTYWHSSFGKQWSNGCVNVPLESAEKLYKWAEVGTKVLVRD